jgi:hypothetical protein
MAETTDLVDGTSLSTLGRGQKFFGTGDPRVLGWVKEAIDEGTRIMKADPAYPKMDQAMEYVLGDQLKKERPSYLPQVVINQSKKSIRTGVSALTDVKPVFAFKTYNPHFEAVSHLLNQLVVAWWVNTFADLDLGDVIKYAKVAGTGDCVFEYDPHFGH